MYTPRYGELKASSGPIAALFLCLTAISGKDSFCKDYGGGEGGVSNVAARRFHVMAHTRSTAGLTNKHSDIQAPGRSHLTLHDRYDNMLDKEKNIQIIKLVAQKQNFESIRDEFWMGQAKRVLNLGA